MYNFEYEKVIMLENHNEQKKFIKSNNDEIISCYLSAKTDFLTTFFSFIFFPIIKITGVILDRN